MGLLVDLNVSPIPVMCEDNIITYWLGEETVIHEITGTKGLKFEKQCNHFKLPRVMGYLKGEQYNMVLRFDGTGTVYTADGKYMRNVFKHGISVYNDLEKMCGGYMYVNSDSVERCVMTDLVHLCGDWYEISCPEVPVTVLLRSSENSFYFSRIKSEPYASVLRIIKDRMYYVTPSGSIGERLKCEIYGQAGFQMLGGVTWRG